MFLLIKHNNAPLPRLTVLRSLFTDKPTTTGEVKAGGFALATDNFLFVHDI
jgi:hypothetical protein